jgi:hypothetical protein
VNIGKGTAPQNKGATQLVMVWKGGVTPILRNGKSVLAVSERALEGLSANLARPLTRAGPILRSLYPGMLATTSP